MIKQTSCNHGTPARERLAGLFSLALAALAVNPLGCVAGSELDDTETSRGLPLDPAHLIPPQALKLVSVDSQELAGENGAGENAIDGDPKTIWHTEWFGTAPLPPHALVIDLGADYSVEGFAYLPRQDGNANGTIAAYTFLLSQDGNSWTDVASGTFTKSTAKKTVALATGKKGRFVKLLAKSELHGNAWTSAAELSIFGTKLNTSPGNIPTGSNSVFYVATDGDDSGDGGKSHPFRSIAKALSVMEAGDTLYLRGGIYSEGIDGNSVVMPSGASWSNATTIASYPGETATLRPSGVGQVIGAISWQYVVFDGLVLDAAHVNAGCKGNPCLPYGYVIGEAHSHHIRFQNCDIKNGYAQMVTRRRSGIPHGSTRALLPRTRSSCHSEGSIPSKGSAISRGRMGRPTGRSHGFPFM